MLNSGSADQKRAITMKPHASDEPENDGAALRELYVDQLKRAGQIRSPLVEAAFRAVPRHLFVPGFPLETVYSDRAINVKPGASSSQPTVIANMLELLQLEPGQRVLEIATGTGYNSALVAHIVGESGRVITVEIDEELAASARHHLETAGFSRVQVVRDDGGHGYRAGAPYDRIIVTTGAWDIAPAWSEQLREGGRLLVPLALLGPSHQLAVCFEAVGDHLESISTYPCVFMMSQGSIAGPPEGGGDLQINAYPQRPDDALTAGEVVLQKRWTRLVMTGWP
jgi:protein-L-isoaspartate(D-aspartate) O-methyltransferase